MDGAVIYGARSSMTNDVIYVPTLSSMRAPRTASFQGAAQRRARNPLSLGSHHDRAYGFRAPAFGRPRNDGPRIWERASSMGKRHLWTGPSSMARGHLWRTTPSMYGHRHLCGPHAYASFRAPAFGRSQNDQLRILDRKSSMERFVLHATQPLPPPVPRIAA
jgi:hypothetical protein